MQNIKKNKLSIFLLASLAVFIPGIASAATVYYTFEGVVDEAKKDASDYGFSTGDILRGTVEVDDGHTDNNSNSEIAEYTDAEIFLRFTVESSGGTLLYSSDEAADDIKIKIEDNHNNDHDKWEMEDKSDTRPDLTRSGGHTSAFDYLKIKIEDKSKSLFSTTVPTVDYSVMLDPSWKKYEFDLKFKSGGEEVQLKGDLSSFVVPIPSAVWLFISALGGLLGWRRKASA
ncbi:MAG: hypothetical protein GY727_10140 [Gammaproteobacteria bacterium]|nr:hypothetical protein [Gammaproteobacteria bacterium]MCP4090817.1 hypothetical protein [Gammaproteobacteria bacterium]MCP4277244.1 hypothetical protein [Gammaproteobacteria bacterium]MCP4832866.1 hypothetical protein [Gammaproteobacteria bacterium]MCP4928965.1 hypothetical protein [Gammaproteobacteria bacterium]